MVGYKNKKGAGTGKRKVHIFSNSHRIKVYIQAHKYSLTQIFS